MNPPSNVENIIDMNLSINVTAITNNLSYCKLYDFWSDPDSSTNETIYKDAMNGTVYGFYDSCLTTGLKNLSLKNPSVFKDFRKAHLQNDWFGLGLVVPNITALIPVNQLYISSAEGNYAPRLLVTYYSFDNTCI
ncbi:MAG: hypothetical protein QW076_03695 [Candidatus Anstonellales archaeon]